MTESGPREDCQLLGVRAAKAAVRVSLAIAVTAVSLVAG